uniref:Capsid protein n=1 Tax=Werosea cyclovirus TaxID=2714177 RepID=A0A858FBR0_9CIRC|nr:capsid protein [Werosea cyclovirus]QIH00036.1 capsid protein [Werosea cyclovirus]
MAARRRYYLRRRKAWRPTRLARSFRIRRRQLRRRYGRKTFRKTRPTCVFTDYHSSVYEPYKKDAKDRALIRTNLLGNSDASLVGTRFQYYRILSVQVRVTPLVPATMKTNVDGRYVIAPMHFNLEDDQLNQLDYKRVMDTKYARSYPLTRSAVATFRPIANFKMQSYEGNNTVRQVRSPKLLAEPASNAIIHACGIIMWPRVAAKTVETEQLKFQVESVVKFRFYGAKWIY